MPFIELGARRIEYTVAEGPGRRYTYFRFRNDMTLEVILPRGRRVDVEKAISARASWLSSQYERLYKTRHVLTPSSVMFGGVHLKIVFAEGPGEGLAPNMEKREVAVHATNLKHIRELVRRWFLKESSSYTVRKVNELAPIVGARPSRVDVREIGKWGYCTRDGRLSFSWQLIALPEELREYVVVHELTHLLHFNHSRAFRKKLATVCPDFRLREKELDLIVPYDRLGLQ